jgi:hypothetical protein
VLPALPEQDTSPTKDCSQYLLSELDTSILPQDCSHHFHNRIPVLLMDCSHHFQSLIPVYYYNTAPSTSTTGYKYYLKTAPSTFRAGYQNKDKTLPALPENRIPFLKQDCSQYQNKIPVILRDCSQHLYSTEQDTRMLPALPEHDTRSTTRRKHLQNRILVLPQDGSQHFHNKIPVLP